MTLAVCAALLLAALMVVVVAAVAWMAVWINVKEGKSARSS